MADDDETGPHSSGLDRPGDEALVRMVSLLRQQVEVGQSLGHYEIRTEIGRGGSSVVYEAWDSRLERPVAIKVLNPGASERLLREASAAARLQHPHIVTVHEVRDDYIVMELVRGRTLDQAAAGRSREERLRLLHAVALAVGYAHGRGIVHRDLKPSNVLVEEGGRVVLTDFGLAALAGASELTRSGSVLGTPPYMSPEQVQGRGVGPATDTWSLGVMLFELLTGRRPFEGDSVFELQERIVRASPPRLPGAAGAVIARALQKDPARRHPSVELFAEDLQRLIDGERVGGGKRPLVLGLLALAGIVIVGFSVGAMRPRARDATAEADPFRCGDGRVQPPVEECDDGNTIENDGCTSACIRCVAETPDIAVHADRGRCYVRHDRPLPYGDAERACERIGAHLVVYGNKEWRTGTDPLLEGGESPLWIGMRRSPRLGFVWFTNEAIENPVFLVDAPAGMDCVAQKPDATGALRLLASACGERRPFLCERTGWTVRPSTKVAYQRSAEKSSWADARARCAAKGAALVTIGDAEEHAFVSSLTSSNSWLGGRRAASGSAAIEWISGEPVGFSRLALPTPGSPQDCLALTFSGDWDFRRCGSPYFYLCETAP